MTGRTRLLDDATIMAAIERRAPGHADPALLADILAEAAQSRRDRVWWPAPLTLQLRLAVLGAVVVTVLACIALLSALGALRVAPSLPSPDDGLTGVRVGPGRSIPIASPAAACAPGAAPVTVGAAMAPTATQPLVVPAGVVGAGAYVTADPGSAVPADVWFARAGIAARIAHVDGAAVSGVRIDALSADGRQALVRVTQAVGSGDDATCADLYVVRTDRESLTRLTQSPVGFRDQDGSFSADGRYVAYRELNGDAGLTAWVVVDELGDATPQITLCNADDVVHLAWAPDDDRLAILCTTDLIMSFVGENPHSGILSPAFQTEPSVLFDWTSSTSIAIATVVPVGTAATPGSEPSLPKALRRHDYVMPSGGLGSEDGTFEDVATSTESFSSIEAGSGVSSPDGSSIAFRATRATDEGWWVMDGTGSVTFLSTDLQPAPDDRIGWTSDGRQVVFVSRPSTGVPQFALVDGRTGEADLFGSIPTTYVQGVWIGPSRG